MVQVRDGYLCTVLERRLFLNPEDLEVCRDVSVAGSGTVRPFWVTAVVEDHLSVYR